MESETDRIRQHQLFTEIKRFERWKDTQPASVLREFNYEHWGQIYQTFEEFIQTIDPDEWSTAETKKLLFIIAKDYETQNLTYCLDEKIIVKLAKESVLTGESDAKWQMALQLNKITDKVLAFELLEQFVNDEDEYVSRRSLMEFAKLYPDQTEAYAVLFWNRNIHGEMDEYQKIAVLQALKTINSPLLETYTEQAKADERKYLSDYAHKIEEIERTQGFNENKTESELKMKL